MMANRNKSTGFLLGALAGGIIGSVTALLLAPKAGKELRQDLADTTGKARETTTRIAGEARAASSRIAKEVSERAVHLAGRAKDAAGSVAESVKGWREAVKPEQDEEIQLQEASELPQIVEAKEAAVDRELQSINR